MRAVLLAILAALLLVASPPTSASSCKIPGDWIRRADAASLVYSVGPLKDARLYPALGNGYIGQQYGDQYLYMAGVYLGNGAVSNGAVRARIPNSMPVVPNMPFFAAALDFEAASFTVLYCDSFNPEMTVNVTTYAHRSRRSLWITEIGAENGLDVQATVMLQQNATHKSPDFNSTIMPNSNFTVFFGHVKRAELKHLKPASVAVVAQRAPSSLSIAPHSSRKLVLVSAMRSSVDSSDVQRDSLYDYQTARASADTLYSEHQAAWAELWMGRIEVSGNTSLAVKINASLYALYSSLRSDLDWAASPGGLTPGYSGNVFWDSDLWVMPAILPFHPGIAQSSVKYRFDRIPAAQDRARTHGYNGAFFPWQSAESGHSVDWFPPFNYLEQHVGGDVGVSTKLQMLATMDMDWMKTVAWPLLSQISDFWVSRVVNRTGHPGVFDLEGVVPPDEYAIGFPTYSGVKNSAYTNGVVSETIRTTIRVANILGQPVPPMWDAVSKKLHVTFKTVPPHHPEYENFPVGNTYFGKKVKQADVILLQYPVELWECVRDFALRIGDLKYYEPMMDPNGPAMTWSAMSLLYVDLHDFAHGEHYFGRASENILAPFAVWSEVPNPDHPGYDAGILNFITGAGGFIQNVVNGYAGLRYRWNDNATTTGALSAVMRLKPVLIPGTTSSTWRNIKFAQSTFTMSIDGASKVTTLTMTGSAQGATPLQVSIGGGSAQPLVVNQPVTFKWHTEVIIQPL